MTAALRRRGGHAALLLIDVVNPFDFPGAGALIRGARRVAPKLAGLADTARAAGTPVIYVNDNFGKWRSDFRATLEGCTREGAGGRDVVAQLRPQPKDFFILKPQHSGFFATALDLLLDYLGTKTLVVAGFAANLCVLFTANDAHMRGYRLVVPRDGTASNSVELTRRALLHVRQGLHAETPRCADVDFAALPRARRRVGKAF